MIKNRERFWYLFCSKSPFLIISILRRLNFSLKLTPQINRRLYPLILGPKIAKYVSIHYLSDPTEAVEAFSPKPGQVVIDIGAHVGAYTVMSASMVKSGKVIAIEAHPANYRLLLKNIKLNDLKNVIPVNIAVLDKEGYVKLYSGKTSGWHSIRQERKSNLCSSYLTVCCTTIDRLLLKLNSGKADWIKIDVEGAELDVLKGMRATLNNNPKLNLLIELHSNPTDTIAYLKTFGFDIRVLSAFSDGRQHIYAVYK
ncbi:MAG: FkbM family methyltransferase [Candidatus Bathyarchaeota archaeon]|nr:FkbM family methyltransferase [Candidatus Bathyarchaeota archaeon]